MLIHNKSQELTDVNTTKQFFKTNTCLFFLMNSYLMFLFLMTKEN
jgi:hypothetical protein